MGIALAVFVYERTGSALAVAALLMATRFGPSLVIAPLAGQLGTQRLGAALGGLYLSAAVIAGILAFVTSAPLVVLYALTFVASTLAATGRVLTRTAGCNALDAHGKLREGAAALNVSSGSINMLGPAIAGAVTVLVGTQAGVLAAAAIFACLAAATWRLGGTAAGSGDTQEPTPAVGFREALRLISMSPGVAAILVASGSLLVLLFMDEPIIIPYIEESLGGSTANYAALLTVWGVGLLLGGLTFALLRRWSMLGTFLLAGTLFAGSYVVFAVADSLAVAYAAAVFGGMGNGLFWASLTVVTLEAVPPAVRTQTAGVTESLAMAAPGIGYLIGGGLSEVLTPAQVYLLAGSLGLGVVACLGLALWRPAVTPAPSPTTAGMT